MLQQIAANNSCLEQCSLLGTRQWSKRDSTLPCTHDPVLAVLFCQDYKHAQSLFKVKVITSELSEVHQWSQNNGFQSLQRMQEIRVPNVGKDGGKMSNMFINYSPQYSHLVITTLHNFHLATRLSSAPKVLGYFNLTSNHRLPATCTQPPLLSCIQHKQLYVLYF